MKSIEEKKQTGTHEPSRDRQSNVVTLHSIPDPLPGTLINRSRPIYDHLALHLIRHNSLSAIDRLAVANAACCFIRLKRAQNALEKAKMVQEFPGGASNVSAEFTAYKTCLQQWQYYEDQLGLTPKARDKMHRTFSTKKRTKSGLAATLGSKPA